MKKLFVICSLLFLQSISFAGYIRLSTSLASKIENGELKVYLSAANKGDESAFNLQPEIIVPPKKALLEKKAELAANGAYQIAVALPFSAPNPGSYPLVMVMHYTDANQYPFSALTAQTFVYQKECPSPLLGQVKPISFNKSGNLEVLIKNLSLRDAKARVTLFAPRELSLAVESQEIEIGAKSQLSLNFPISNFSALAGSTYQVFTLIETNIGNSHSSVFIPGTVKIAAAQEIFGLNTTAILVILAGLVIIFIGTQFIKKA